MSVKFQINKFNPKTLPDAGVVAFVGRSNSGKTFCLKDIIYHKRRFQKAVVLCGSEGTAKELRNKIPDLMIHDHWDEKMMSEIYEKQERDMRLNRASRLLIIVDDLMHQKNLLKQSKTMQRIFFSGRHAKILLLLSMQYCKNLGPDMRQQISYTFLTFEKLPANRHNLFDTFNNVFNSYAEFDSVMKAITQNYTMMVLCNSFNPYSDISHNVFWYKAQRRRHFRVGKHGLMWKQQQFEYDPFYFMRGHEDEMGVKDMTKVENHKRRISTVFVERTGVETKVKRPKTHKKEKKRRRRKITKE